MRDDQDEPATAGDDHAATALTGIEVQLDLFEVLSADAAAAERLATWRAFAAPWQSTRVPSSRIRSW